LVGDEEDLEHVCELTSKLEPVDPRAGSLGELGARTGGKKYQAAGDRLEERHAGRSRGSSREWCFRSA
jgi:hypothetical protein